MNPNIECRRILHRKTNTKRALRLFQMEGHTMDLQNMDLRGGSLQISTEVLGKIARCAALEVEGVAAVSCGSQNKKRKELLERTNVQAPVSVVMKDGTAEITLHVVQTLINPFTAY